MVKRGSGLSPQKDVRRSSRERSMVYRSLAENDLAEHHLRGSFMKSIIRSATEQLHKELISGQPVAGYTRSGRRIGGGIHYVESDSTDEDDYEKRRRRRRFTKERYNDENVDIRSPSPKRCSEKRRAAVEDGVDHEKEKKQEDSEQHDDSHSNMYDNIKRERKTVTTSLPNSPRLTNGTESARSVRQANRERLSNGVVKDEPAVEIEGSRSSEETEEDDEKTPEPRQYSLRKVRQPVDRFASTVTPKERHRDDRERRSRGRSTDRRDRKAKRAAKRRRRELGSDSSSTSSSDSDDIIRTRNDDLRFERRKERSLAKARNRYLPINLSDKDLSASQAVIRERLRQTGGSCTDIDPMSIDSGIGFEQVGGLGSHIQSLKEVVLFPMLYPEIFKQFNIMPPKGVVFYGPPGTGKTLMARALANECSKGGKKVAFFMRKGADCLSKWVGEAERQLRVLFDQAYAMRPSIIFFDEIDGLAPVRSSKQDQIHSSIVSTLLALMDGLDNRGEYLCTEAVLVALRSRFPHIYMSKERLKLDPSDLVIDKNCFTTAMRRITPASRRDLSIPSRQLDERTSILLLSTVTSILDIRIPTGYRSSQSVQNTAATELEKVVRALEQPPCVPAVRLMLCGSAEHPDLGQTSYVLPAVLGKLDHLPVFSIAVARLFADGRPEETLAQTVQSALRAAASGPCILLLPSIDQWYEVVPPSVAHMLATALDSLHGFTSILFLASCDCAYDSCCNEVKDLFGPSQCLSLRPPKEQHRRRYFEHILASARIPPKVFDPSLYQEPEKAADEVATTSRKLNEKEARELVKIYESQLRRFRIWARDKLSRIIRHNAHALWETVVDLFDVDLDVDFVESLENNAKMLADAGVQPTNEKLLELPPRFKRTVPWSVNAGYMTQLVKESDKEANGEKREQCGRKLGKPDVASRIRGRVGGEWRSYGA
ncbi:ATPase, AAA family [Ancylostoma duodenale]|uniref:ATPase, AAA family n=1 Tax=Ancylostoma duodenale TaxID=51022 RepID=A0A0C2HC65_9BILA|nr:ATPase, AAA family [Ancylostoma duodenale]